MRCCVPFCRSTTENVSTSQGKADITFFGFPSEVHLRTAWLKAVGKQDSHRSNSAVVCSQHFLDDEMYETESGLRQVYAGAVPSTVQICMICLDSDRKMLLMSKHKLEEAYEKLTGYSLFDPGNLKQTVCVLCAQRLRNFRRFRANSLRARSLMMNLVEKQDLITQQHIKQISCAKNELKDNLVQTTLGSDHCDTYIIEPDENVKIKTEKTDLECEIVVVKNEESYYSMDDEYNKGINADNGNEEFAASEDYSITDNSVTVEVKPLEEELCKALQRNLEASSSMVAEQWAGIQVPIKCEYAPEYDEPIPEHMQSGGGDVEGGTSEVCTPNAVFHSSYVSLPYTERKCDIQMLNGDSTADSTRALATAKNPDTTKKIRKRNQSSDSINKANRKKYRAITNSLKVLPNQEDQQATRKPSSFDGHDVKTPSKDISHQSLSNNAAPATQSKPKRAKGRGETKSNAAKCPQEINALKKKQFTCSICSNAYYGKALLLKHMKTHSETGNRNRIMYTCNVCQYQTRRKNHYTMHLRIHTGEKPYACEICHHKTISSSLLAQHMRTHTGEKPFACQLCKFASVRNCDLVLHMRTHTGEKRYACELCEYKCIRNSDLVIHMRTHTGEQPYRCEVCERKFSHTSALAKHMRIHVPKTTASRK